MQTTNVQNSTQTNTSPSAVTANTTSVALCSSNASWLSGGTYAYSATGQGDNSAGTFGYNSVVYTENTDSDQTFTSASFNTYTTNTTGTNYNGTATSTQSTSLNCYQASTETLYTAGTSLDSTWNLSSYSLTAIDTLIASNSTLTNTSNTYNGTNPDRTTFNGYGNSTQSQTNSQQQVSQWDEQGAVNNGVFNLSLVSFTSTAQYTTNYYSYSSQAGTSGTYSNSDSSTLTATLGGNFTETAVGNFLGSTSTTGFGSFNTVTQQGSSYGSYALSQSGAVNGEAYSHSDTLTETTTLYLTGSDNPYNSGGALQSGWSLASYNVTTDTQEIFADTVKGVNSNATIDGQTSLIGNSTQATLTQSGNGSAWWGTRGYNYSGNVVQTVSLSAPWPLIFWPAGQHSWLGALFPSTGIAQLPDALKGITQLLQAMPMPSVLAMTTLPTMWSSLATPPMLAVPTPQAYGGWLLPQGALSGTMLTPTWAPSNSFENWTQMVNWGSVSQAYLDVLNKAQTVIGSRNPTSLYGQNAFTAAAGQLGATINGDYWAALGELQDAVGGVLNIVTAGQSNRVLGMLGLDALVNTNSAAYRVGQVVGVVLLLLLPSGGIIGNFVLAMQVTGNLWNAYDAFRNGDYVGAAMSLAFAAIGANRLLGSFRGGSGPGSISGAASSGGSSSLGSGQNLLGSGAQNFFGGTVGNVWTGVQRGVNALTSPTSTLLGSVAQGAAAGAILGFFGYVVPTGILSAILGQNLFSWGGLTGSVLGGAVGGAMFAGLRTVAGNGGWATVGVGSFSGLVGGGVGGAVDNAITQAMQPGNFNWGEFWTATGSAALGGAIGGGIAGASAFYRGSNPAVGRSLLLSLGTAGGIVGGGVAAWVSGGDPIVGAFLGGGGGFTATSVGLGAQAWGNSIRNNLPQARNPNTNVTPAVDELGIQPGGGPRLVPDELGIQPNGGPRPVPDEVGIQPGGGPRPVADELGIQPGGARPAAPDPPRLFDPPLPVRFQRAGAGIRPADPQAQLFGPDLPDGTYCYAMAPNGQILVVPVEGHVHPRILGNGMPATGAGELTIQGGVVIAVDNISGTFRFGGRSLANVIRALQMQGGTVAPNAAQPFRWR